MWDYSPEYFKAKARAKAAKKRLEKDAQRTKYQLKRVQAELKVSRNLNQPPLIIPARVLLNDFSESGVPLFADLPLPIGETVSMAMVAPKEFFVMAKVCWCVHKPVTSQVISPHQYAYRIGLQFIFNSEAERIAVQIFTRELFGNYLVQRPSSIPLNRL